LCSPTRASILTGQYPARLRLTTPACHLPQEVLDPRVPDRASPHHHVVMPETRTRLPNDYVTFAEVLKTAGYRTALLGKWHLGREPYLPESQGFDVVVGGRHHPGPPGGYFAPWPCETLPQSPDGTHIDDAITSEAIKFLENNRDNAFLLNLWFYCVHAPFEAKQPLIEKYRAKAKADPANRQTNPVMGAMIETLDENVGRVLDVLKRLGLSENTLVIFTSDNGGNMYNFVQRSRRHRPARFPELPRAWWGSLRHPASDLDRSTLVLPRCRVDSRSRSTHPTDLHARVEPSANPRTRRPMARFIDIDRGVRASTHPTWLRSGAEG